MSIINYSVSIKNSIYSRIRNWEDIDYYYVQAEIDKPIIIPETIISNDNITIAICIEFEPDIKIVDYIYKNLIISKNLNPKRILLLSENYDLEFIIRQTANYYNQDTIVFEYTMAHHGLIQSQIKKNKKFKLLKEIIPKSKHSDKFFLNFNRRWRMHRPLLVMLLFSKKLLNKGHVSLASMDGHSFSNFMPQLLNELSTNKNLLNLCLNHVDQMAKFPDLYLDSDNLKAERHHLDYGDINETQHINLYKETMFSVVSETLFFENIGRFISEKTLKAIAHNHPFILVGPAYSLDLLRKLGYKTFSPYINEDYDTETNPLLRLEKILDEIERLCNFTEKEIENFVEKTKEITHHNFLNIFKNYKLSVRKL